MAQPTNPPLSVRLPPDVLAALDASRLPDEARNAALVRALREHLLSESVMSIPRNHAERQAVQRKRNALARSVVDSLPLGPQPYKANFRNR